MIGLAVLDGFVPDFDATVVTSILAKLRLKPTSGEKSYSIN